MADDDNVLALPIGDARRAHNQRESEIADLPVSSKRSYSLDACKHAHSVVDARARTVTCSSCGVTLDPIEVLDRIAVEFAEPIRRVHEAQRRFRELSENVWRLEREERNAKGRVRAARRRALTFDLAAVDAALVEQYKNHRWGPQDFRALTPDEQKRAREAIVPLIEAYVAALTESEGT